MARAGGIGGSGGGSVLNEANGISTNAFVTVLSLLNLDGLMGIGTIKNTDGANDILVKETVIDSFGVIGTVTTLVAAGDSYMLDLQTNFPIAAVPPYISYTVEVKSAVDGAPADFELFITTMEGAGIGSSAVSFPQTTYVFAFPSDLSTSVGSNALIPWLPGAGKIISQLLAVLKTAPTGANVIIEFFRGTLATGVVGASLGTVTILAGAFTGSTQITPTTILTTEFVAMTVTQIGSVIPGANLTGIAR